jgi:hypothetical protein
MFLTFYVEKPTALLSFLNMNEWRKKRKLMQKLKKINIMASKASTDMVPKEKNM